MNQSKRVSRRRLWAVLVLVAIPIGSWGCADPSTPEPERAPGTFIGTVEGTDIRVGVVVGRAEAAIFFCGGPASLPTTTWSRANGGPGDFDFTSGYVRAHALVAATRVTGTFEPGDGRVLSFAADRVSEDGVPGLYEQSDGEGRAAVVVFADDQLQGAFIRANDSVVMQIVPVKEGRIELNAASFTVRVGARELTVSRVRPR